MENYAKAEITYPLAYHVTFSCYGTRLHGSESGSVHQSNTIYGSPRIQPDSTWQKREMECMRQPPYSLDELRRKIVLEAIRGECSYRNWKLFAVHVRSTHVHVVVSATDKPEKVMKNFKSYASRALNEAGLDGKNRRRWARHGSTRYLWDAEEVERVINYVLNRQGKPMEVHGKL